MEGKNIKVIKPKYIKDLDINQSLWVRDSSIVIGDQFILLQLQNNNTRRKLEYKTVHFNKNIIQKNKEIKIEGGDIIQMKAALFIGINKRTDINGYRWIKQLFPDKHVIKINHKALHLDCCFSIYQTEQFYIQKNILIGCLSIALKILNV